MASSTPFASLYNCQCYYNDLCFIFSYTKLKIYYVLRVLQENAPKQWIYIILKNVYCKLTPAFVFMITSLKFYKGKKI